MRTIVHVHQQVIAKNRKHGTNEPPLTVKMFRSTSRYAKPIASCHASEVEITGPCKVIHSPHDPLPCGARVWIETESEVICDGSVLEAAEAVRAAASRESRCDRQDSGGCSGVCHEARACQSSHGG